jgi:hypothetical protein
LRSRLIKGSGTMPDYRAYIVGIDGQFNSIITEFPHNHPDDATAIEAAIQLVGGHDIELWDRDRFVGRFSPEAK